MIELLFFIAAFIAEVVGTMAGFGSSTIFLPLALFFVDFKTALILVAFLHIFGNLGRITFFRHGLNKKLLLVFGVPSVILTILGALLVNYTSQEILKLVLGIFLLLFSILSLAKPDFRFKSSPRNAVVGGGISGFLAGLIGTGGALRGAFLTAFNLKKEVYIATAAAIAIAVDITRIPIYFGSGFLKQQFYWYLPLLFGIAIAGSYVGKKIVNKIPQKSFRKFVLGVIALLSLKFIYDGVISLF
ncbi:sulfite exporter TauE/SafE family protein [Candidatus Woesearchaeota archaeon]|nr:sulfite exporter TauE/SafE family protein [Candidatus Woesearchaeota archaeon]